jgi:hypothetical protein
MTTKNWMMVALLAALAGIYIFYFSDWFRPKIIHISHASRAIRMRGVTNPRDLAGTVPVTFSLDRPYRPTEIKVVLLAAWQTNQNVLPVWHLIVSTNRAPIKVFSYGQRIRGLKPAVPGTHAQPLEPNATYRLFVTAGSARGQHDFEARSAE